MHCEEVQKIWPVRKVLVFEDVREPWRYQAWTFKRRAIQRWEREAAEGRKIWFGRGWIVCILFGDCKVREKVVTQVGDFTEVLVLRFNLNQFFRGACGEASAPHAGATRSYSLGSFDPTIEVPI